MNLNLPSRDSVLNFQIKEQHFLKILLFILSIRQSVHLSISKKGGRWTGCDYGFRNG